jgi:alpha-tubulin suppressor-like RCC1 family protein
MYSLWISELMFIYQPEIDTRRILNVKMISSGYDFTVLLDSRGDVWTWGESMIALG